MHILKSNFFFLNLKIGEVLELVEYIEKKEKIIIFSLKKEIRLYLYRGTINHRL